MFDEVTDETLATALDQLAASRDEDEIAEALAELGCQGTVGNPRSCPVARYLAIYFGHPHGIRFAVVGHAVAALQEYPRRTNDGEEWMDLLTTAQVNDPPGPLRRFITEFDAEEYPFLVAR